MTRNLTIWRMIASFCLALVLVGAAAATTLAAPGEIPAPAAATFQDDDDDDDDDGGGYDDGGQGGVSGLPATGAGTTAGAPDATFQDDDDDDDDDDRGGVSGLPSTGAGTTAGQTRGTNQDDDDDDGGSSLTGHATGIYAGSCAGFDQNAAVSLDDAAPRGDDDDNIDESSTEIDRSFDDLVAQPHVIAVLTDSGTACADVAGAVVDDTLVVGLQTSGAAGWTGIAIVEDDDDDDAVEVTVYVFPAMSAPAPAPAAPVGDDDGDDV